MSARTGLASAPACSCCRTPGSNAADKKPSWRPRPRSIGLLVHLGKDLARDAKTVDAGRDARIAGDLHEDLADFVLADAVDQRTLDMHPQFMWPVQDRDHGEVEHAAGFARQLLAAPDRAPAIF